MRSKQEAIPATTGVANDSVKGTEVDGGAEKEGWGLRQRCR